MNASKEKNFTPLSITDSPVIYDRDEIDRRKRRKLRLAIQAILLKAQEKE